MNCTRRQLFKRTLIATAVATLPITLQAASGASLYIPPLMDSRRGRPIFLTAQSTAHALVDNQMTDVWGFNGNYLGPTIRVRKGDFVKLNLRNNLSSHIALNPQGVQTSGELRGGLGKVLKPGENWAPILPINQSAATCWYHSSLLAHSAYQTYRGLVGLWLIEDEESKKLPLPQQYGVNDIPLILQDQRLNKEGVQLFQNNQSLFLGNQLFVNGQISPYLNVPRGWVRLRLVNASLSRHYELRLDEVRPMFLIAQDQGFLPQQQEVESVTLGPSERVELLINLNEGEEVSLIAGHKRGIFDQLRQIFASEDELIENIVLTLRPQGLPAVFSKQESLLLPNDAVELLKQPVAQERSFHIDSVSAMINGKPFDPKRMTYAKLGSVERWTLTSSAPTGFKIQGAKFIVESRNGQALEQSQIAWKDSLWIEGKTQILVKFENPSSHNYPFLFGAANLLLADKGALELLVVQ